MPRSEDNDHRHTPPAPPKVEENPFIRFRQFADEQISSLLQGVIGLPSAFSRSATENLRWAEVDNDLRRRDELQARQKDLKESGLRKAEQENYEDSNSYTPEMQKWTSPNQHDRNDQALQDLPLYSPVSRSLFTHLGLMGNQQKEWPAVNPFQMLALRPIIRQDQFPADHMRNVQLLAFDNLNRSPLYRSEYSLLPYLLFSPYSPIKLSMDAASSGHLDDFPYCTAFQDLLEISHGQPNETNGRRWANRNLFVHLFSDPASRAAVAMDWIDTLHQTRLLQEKALRTEQMINPFKSSTSSFDRPESVILDMLDSVGPQTEEEMYERFLSSATNVGGLGSLFAEIEKSFKELEQQRNEQVQTPPRTSNNSPSSVIEEPASQKSTRVQQSSTAPETASTDKVVSTSTTSEHLTDEEGNLKTTVTVWKRFADGRESLTTTTHTEEASKRQDMTTPEKQSNLSGSNQADEAGKKRKGWFWN